MLSAADVRAIDGQCRRDWTYRVNSVSQWRSYGDAILAGKPWGGDCTDLVSSVLDLMGRRAEPLMARFRILVSTTGAATPDHMIGAWADGATGRWWIIGDTFDAMYPAEQTLHRGVEYNRLDEIDANAQPTWRAGLPWAAEPRVRPQPIPHPQIVE